jgi:hypothetical protein
MSHESPAAGSPRWWKRTVSEGPPTFGRVVGAGFLGGVVAWVVAVAAYLAGQRLGLALEVAATPTTPVEPLPLPAFIGVTIVPGLVAGMIGGKLRRRPRGPRTMWIVGGVIMVISLASPLNQPAAVPWIDRGFLAALHVIVYIIVVGSITRAMRGKPIG